MKDDCPFVFAGLWEGWKDPANDEWWHTCTMSIAALASFSNPPDLYLRRS
jgi:putative SOS response-associated peptidase YedK